MLDPYTLIAKALGCQKETLTIESGLNRHPDWDSFGHLNVILAIEEAYRIKIEDDEIMRFSDMREIVLFYQELQKIIPKPQ